MKKIISFVIRKIPRKYLQLVSPLAMTWFTVWYKGTKYYCPIDGRGYRKLLPYGRIDPRENALAPGSLSLERHRLLWLYLKRNTSFFQDKLRFLHVAPEHCFLKPFESQHKEGYITGDIESPLAKIKMDVHKIPFENNYFDAAMCNHVMEHVDSDIKAFSEFFRVIRPGGWAIFQVPFFYPIPEITEEDPNVTSPAERERLYGQDDHVRKYGRDYADRIRSVGFEVTEDHFASSLTKEEISKFALPENEVIYFARKPLDK